MAGIAANLLLRAAAPPLSDVSPRFRSLDAESIIAFTAGHLVVATLVFAALAGWTGHPVRHFRSLAAVVLLLSLVPDLLLLAPDAAARNPFAAGATPAAVDALMAMRAGSAAITVWTLTTLPRRRA